MTSFADLGLRAELVAALAAEGISDPFPIQEATIRDSLAGRDVCGKAKTGSGKTLAFGLPMLERTPVDVGPGRPACLVLVPTRELARQVVDVLSPLARAIGLRTMARCASPGRVRLSVHRAWPVMTRASSLRRTGCPVTRPAGGAAWVVLPVPRVRAGRPLPPGPP